MGLLSTLSRSGVLKTKILQSSTIQVHSVSSMLNENRFDEIIRAATLQREE